MNQVEQNINATLSAPVVELLCEFRDDAPDGPIADVGEFAVSVTFRSNPTSTPLLDCTEDNGRIQWDRPTGRVYLVLTAEDVAMLAPYQARFDVRVQRPDRIDWWPRFGRLNVETPYTR